MRHLIAKILVWVGMLLIHGAPWAIPKGRAVGVMCGLHPDIIDKAFLLTAQCERTTGTGENKRHNALRALLNLGFKERDAALAIEVAVRSVL